MDTSLTQSVNIQETFQLDFYSNNFHSFWFLRSGKGEIDVYLFMFKHSSDQYELFCQDPLSHLAIDTSTCMKV